MKKENKILGREITSDSLRGLIIIGKEVNKEIAPYLRNWSKYSNNSKVRSYVKTLEEIWKEIQIIGYSCTDDLVREAFASL